MAVSYDSVKLAELLDIEYVSQIRLSNDGTITVSCHIFPGNGHVSLYRFTMPVLPNIVQAFTDIVDADRGPRLSYTEALHLFDVLDLTESDSEIEMFYTPGDGCARVKLNDNNVLSFKHWQALATLDAYKF